MGQDESPQDLQGPTPLQSSCWRKRAATILDSLGVEGVDMAAVERKKPGWPLEDWDPIHD